MPTNRITGRAQVLEALFEHEGIQIIGLQETRIQDNFDTKSISFHVISSGAHRNGSQGVQIWISLALKHTVLSSLPISPRCLFVVVDIFSRTLILCVLHIPDSASQESVEAVWSSWAAAIRRLRTKYPSAKYVGFCDANGRVGSEHSPNIGGVQADIEDERGEKLRGV